MNRWFRHEALRGRLTRGRAPAQKTLVGGGGDLRAGRALERQLQEDDRRRRRVGLGLTALIALVSHAGLLLPLFALWMENTGDAAAPDGKMRVVQLSKSAWQQNRELELPPAEQDPARAREREEKPDPDEAVAPGQVVRLPPPAQEERPDEADYASEWDQKTDRETRSRHQTHRYKNPTRAPQVGKDAPEAAPPGQEETAMRADQSETGGGPAGPGRAVSGDTGTDRESGGEAAPKFAFEIPRQSSRARLKLDLDLDGSRKNQQQVEEIPTPSRRFRLSLGREQSASEEPGTAADGEGRGQGQKGGSGAEGLPSLAELTPSLRDLERVTGAPANDYLPEVETDAETRLNAWRWKHATFFNRIADGIRRAWEGPDLLQTRDPAGNIYGTRDLLTVLAVTIDEDGNLVNIDVAESSGATFLDDEAIRTFRVTAPFTNPPKGLFAGKDRFTFTFGFNVSYRKVNFDLDWRPY